MCGLGQLGRHHFLFTQSSDALYLCCINHGSHKINGDYMSLREKFQDGLKKAMQERDEVATSTLRLILAAVKDRDIAARSKGNTDGVTDDEILGMLQTMIKQRRDTIKVYEKANRQELADREQEEIIVVQKYLPVQITGAEAHKAIEEVIHEEAATSIKDMGKVMAALREKYAGQMDFGRASAVVKEKLVAK